MGQRRKKVRREKCEAGYEGREGQGGERVGEEELGQNPKKGGSRGGGGWEAGQREKQGGRNRSDEK